MFKTHSDQLAM